MISKKRNNQPIHQNPKRLKQHKSALNKDSDKGNPGLADALKKVLKTGTKSTTKKSVILAKAKLHTSIQESSEKRHEIPTVPLTGVENSTNIKNVKLVSDIKPDIRKKSIKKQEYYNRGRHKPTVLDRETERPLMKVATRGVVQLFNAVREQQQVINKQIAEVGPSESKKEKVLKSVTQKSFLDILIGNKEPTEKVKEEVIDTDTKPEWNVLRNDFMMGAKLKDWDKAESRAEIDDDSSKPKKKRPK